MKQIGLKRLSTRLNVQLMRSSSRKSRFNWSATPPSHQCCKLTFMQVFVFIVSGVTGEGGEAFDTGNDADVEGAASSSKRVTHCAYYEFLELFN